MSLRAHDVQTAGGEDLLAVLLAAPLRFRQGGVVFLLGRVEDAGSLLVQDLSGHHLRVAAEQDVRAAAGHVGRDGHRA